MKLSYRGISYEQAAPATETTPAETGGKYRGCDWRFRNLKKPPVLQPTRNLVYRGVTYNRGEAAETNPTPITQQARRLFLNRQQEQRNRQQAMLNRSSAEVGLPLETL
ncbi:DUF4278 domain-containing protein [Oscillatoria sp. FACHB-1406]|uniref:DUF4278 domain-containing protein n=1 Tax=Oscillatoria sp. FACHB-1406 TaxID=2692846 RepID=UPI001682F6F6|nr:DUF4278 domain-containing protein [Oscillatoria sp. FACHB-1406]MBD2578960.1 DUF4278 domain-containing protein [Oscillatoria sp. FACHB-1406]